MNFQELLSKITALDTPVVGEELNSKAQSEDVLDVDECGMGPMDSMKQQDNVNMSINMNGSGTGGIRDLLDILRNIDAGGEDASSLGDLIGQMEKGPEGGNELEMPVGEYANEPDEVYGTVDQAIPTGDDLHSKGEEFPKVNGGGNPMYMEQLKTKLSSLYDEIKNR